MKITSTALILILTLAVVPVLTYLFGTPLDPLQRSALHDLLWTAGIAAALCFVLGEVTGNCSQVDKIWSILPVIYLWIVAWHGHFGPRLVLMAVLVTLWGARLTYNFALKGAYQWAFWGGEEDYRWKILRAKPEFQGRGRWTIFNLLFICGYQNALILLFTLPALLALPCADAPLGYLDFAAAGLMLLFLVFETVADRQQWLFQKEKWRRIHAGEPLGERYEKGFNDQGLWALSRHPNYFGEQGQWLAFYLFSVSCSGLWINWSITGSMLLLVLFRASSDFSEEISASKYPAYTDYQKRVPRFWPLGGKK
jgi:steroid 5-alpha reductase family enzyme